MATLPERTSVSPWSSGSRILRIARLQASVARTISRSGEPVHCPWQRSQTESEGGDGVATVRDVAQAAGVSVTTVSRVVRGERYVRPEVREAVQAAMADLDYRPSTLARQFREQRTRVVGFVVPDISEPFYAGILRGVEKALRPAGLHRRHPRHGRAGLAGGGRRDHAPRRPRSGPHRGVLAARGRRPSASDSSVSRCPWWPSTTCSTVCDVDAVYLDNEAGAATAHAPSRRARSRAHRVRGRHPQRVLRRGAAGRLPCRARRGGPASRRAPRGDRRLALRECALLRAAHHARAGPADGHRGRQPRRGARGHEGGPLPRAAHPRRTWPSSPSTTSTWPSCWTRRSRGCVETWTPWGPRPRSLLFEQLYPLTERETRQIRLPHEFVARRSLRLPGEHAMSGAGRPPSSPDRPGVDPLAPGARPRRRLRPAAPPSAPTGIVKHFGHVHALRGRLHRRPCRGDRGPRRETTAPASPRSPRSSAARSSRTRGRSASGTSPSPSSPSPTLTSWACTPSTRTWPRRPT